MPTAYVHNVNHRKRHENNVERAYINLVWNVASESTYSFCGVCPCVRYGKRTVATEIKIKIKELKSSMQLNAESGH